MLLAFISLMLRRLPKLQWPVQGRRYEEMRRVQTAQDQIIVTRLL